MKELNANKKPQDNIEKVVYTASELMALGDIRQKYLLEHLLPQTGCAVLVGQPDTGKSQFARQLCIHIALGLKDFLGFKLSPIVNKVIYVATEDDRDSIKYLLSKQLQGTDEKYYDNLKFVFADTLDPKEIIKTLEKEMAKEQVSLVVVDSYGDIFNGNDSNNNMAMRNTVKSYDKLAKRYGCLILFVHHINKKGYKSSPSQQHIQGGSGLTQKVRVAIQLSDGEDNIRYLSVVKGNYCPKEYKSNSLELTFSEDSFLFTNTGKKVSTSKIGNTNTSSKSTQKYNNKVKTMEEIMTEDTHRHTELVKLYCEKNNKSESTAIRVINELTEQNVLKKNEDGTYSLNNKS